MTKKLTITLTHNLKDNLIEREKKLKEIFQAITGLTPLKLGHSHGLTDYGNLH